MVSRPGEDNTVPGLPEEWGRVVIPDDVSELDDLAEEVRFELGVVEDLPAERRQRRLPFIVIAVTLAIALVSLFTVPWLGRAGQTTPPKPSVSTTVDSSVPRDCEAGTSCDSTAPASSVTSG